MTGTSKTMNFNFSVLSPAPASSKQGAPSAVEYLEVFREIRVNSWLRIQPFYAKRTQFSPFLAPKQLFGEKTNPIRTQTNPILSAVLVADLASTAKSPAWYCKGEGNIVQECEYEAECADAAEKEENGLV